MTRVVSVKGLSTAESKALIARPGFRYCGRNVRWWRDSGLGNPFKAPLLDGGPGLACRLYLILLEQGPAAALAGSIRHYARIADIPREAELARARRLALDAMPSLRGGVLACWCGPAEIDPASPVRSLAWAPPCHAVILAAAAEGLLAIAGGNP
jgi:hypothetical protein